MGTYTLQSECSWCGVKWVALEVRRVLMILAGYWTHRSSTQINVCEAFKNLLGHVPGFMCRLMWSTTGKQSLSSVVILNLKVPGVGSEHFM